MRKPEVVIESVSNGLGSQSMWLLVLAAHGIIPARVSITADTGAELDCLWSTGRRSTLRAYFEEIAKPYAEKHGIDARLVRAVDKEKKPLPALMDHLKEVIADGKMKSAKIPLFGSQGGRLMQVCTDKWKIRAIRQEARRMGATKLITYQGIHFGEAARRVKGIPMGKHGAWSIYQDTLNRNVDGEKVEIPVKWCFHCYPMVDRQEGRKAARERLAREGIPWLLSTECDCCPHQDLDRWMKHTPETLVQIAEVEASMDGKFFFTDERVPLMQALEIKKTKPRNTLEPTFGCGNGICGI